MKIIPARPPAAMPIAHLVSRFAPRYAAEARHLAVSAAIAGERAAWRQALPAGLPRHDVNAPFVQPGASSTGQAISAYQCPASLSIQWE